MRLTMILLALALTACESRIETLENHDLKCWRLTDDWGLTGQFKCEPKAKP